MKSAAELVSEGRAISRNRMADSKSSDLLVAVCVSGCASVAWTARVQEALFSSSLIGISGSALASLHLLLLQQSQPRVASVMQQENEGQHARDRERVALPPLSLALSLPLSRWWD